MSEKTQLPKALLEHPLWETEINPIWLSTSFLLRRNLARYNFPPKMNQGQLEQILSLIKNHLLKSPSLQTPLYLSAAEISILDKEFLYEHFFSLDGFQNTLPGQGFIVDDSGHFLAELNIQNHLQIQLVDSQGSWEKVWNQWNEMETAMTSSIDFAFSPKFGYLTAEPAFCGTGLTVQAHLHLPALIHKGQLQEMLIKHKEEGVSATGIRGNLEDLIGDLIIVSNNFTLGINEEGIIHSVHSMVMKLMAAEKSLRSELQLENDTTIRDQVSRAYGLLLHSYQLQIKEALDALSLIKLGLHLNWIEGITDSTLNTLFLQCRKAHLLYAIGAPFLNDPVEIAHKRAEYLHKTMQGVLLTQNSS